MASSPPSIQGRRLEAQSFPSPGHVPPTFLSRSRCLIDLGKVLIVLTEGSKDTAELAYQRTLYRLELSTTRETVAFVDDSRFSKDECEVLLMNELEAFPNCQIVGVRFPFFDEGKQHMTKYRPCVALWGSQGPALYVSFYMGAPRSSESASYPWEIYLKGKTDLAPSNAPDHILDVTKVCGLPEKYFRPGDVVDGKSTWALFYLNNNDERSVLTASEPELLRGKVLDALVTMLRQSPLSYMDATQELDVGSWVESLELVDGEWCVGLTQYSIDPVEHKVEGAIGAAISDELSGDDADFGVPLVAALSQSRDSDSDGSQVVCQPPAAPFFDCSTGAWGPL